MFLTYRYRVKDATCSKYLEKMARAVNFVWNYCGDVQIASRRHNKKRPSAYELGRLTAGTSKELGLHSYTIEAVCAQFVVSRDKARRRPRWRGKRSLGWVPFKQNNAVKIDGDGVVFLGRRYRLWLSRPVEQSSIRNGSFSQDARGRWYLNLCVEIQDGLACGAGEIGVDLGLKTLAALSDGGKVENLRHYRRYSGALARSQRARNKRRSAAIHAKIVNSRKHHLHEQSTRLVRENKLIVVGDVNPQAMTKTKMAKSVLDASWAAFRYMLRYKAIAHGARYVEVNEAWSSVTCSACGSRSGPEGRKGLRVRAWVCGECGASHDRDTNAAINILLGAECRPPVAEIAAKVSEGIKPHGPIVKSSTHGAGSTRYGHTPSSGSCNQQVSLHGTSSQSSS